MRNLALLLTVVLALCAGCVSRPNDPTYSPVRADDARMNDAILKAKATFPQFLAALRSPKPGWDGFAVKKPYPIPGGGVEHMWIADIVETGGGFEGTVANEAVDTKEVREGQRVRFAAAEISDWKYVDHGDLVGGYTIRYFTDQMSTAEKAAMEKEAGFRIR